MLHGSVARVQYRQTHHLPLLMLPCNAAYPSTGVRPSQVFLCTAATHALCRRVDSGSFQQQHAHHLQTPSSPWCGTRCRRVRYAQLDRSQRGLKRYLSAPNPGGYRQHLPDSMPANRLGG